LFNIVRLITKITFSVSGIFLISDDRCFLQNLHCEDRVFVLARNLAHLEHFPVTAFAQDFQELKVNGADSARGGSEGVAGDLDDVQSVAARLRVDSTIRPKILDSTILINNNSNHSNNY
jgi:hypothetical protein